jgi:hypothetical protein
MKKFASMFVLSTMLATPAYAVDANTTTNTSTDVNTTQNSGVSLSGKAKVMPHATINTGDNTATTDVRTSTDATSRAMANDNDTMTNNNYNRERGRGHKYGHDKHNR